MPPARRRHSPSGMSSSISEVNRSPLAKPTLWVADQVVITDLVKRPIHAERLRVTVTGAGRDHRKPRAYKKIR